MERLLAIEIHERGRSEYLEKVLPYVRWQFLSMEVLLASCRDRAVRNCKATREALQWLLNKQMPAQSKRKKPRELQMQLRRRRSYVSGVTVIEEPHQVAQ